MNRERFGSTDELDRAREARVRQIAAHRVRRLRHVWIFAVVAAVAPLLGLLGTVTGMISTFDIITEFGTGDPKMDDVQHSRR